MINESIFTFLSKDEIFIDVYEKALEAEKNVFNEKFDTAFNNMRNIIEKLVKIIVLKDRQDAKLSKEFYSKKSHTTLSDHLYRCSRKGYITDTLYNKLDTFNREFGNVGSHDSDEKFKIEDVKESHELIFDFSLFVFKRFNKRINIEYSYDLSYLENNNAYTKDEVSHILSDITQSEVSSDAILDKAREEFISKDQLSSIFSKYGTKIDSIENQLSSMEFITIDDLNPILSDLDDSIKKDILKDINNAQEKHVENISEMLNEFEGRQVSLPQIKELINESTDNLRGEILNSIKIIASELIEKHLNNIVNEMSTVKVIEDNTIIDAPSYEVIESEDSFEIKEIEEILGIPDKCPKCGAKLKKGSTRCPNCDYDLFDELNKRCPKCGKRIPLGSKFCIRCGNDLEKYKCHKCGYENKKGTKFCIKCGNAL
ncbi:MAG: zinc-ribbon domain-containing protein [Methanobrevibacter sp.]|nr:zinc-ribbon domain-containing protein [Methanobrevibacter sp.]